jgi:DNA-binding HxlR family transcriptional regulator
VLAAKLRALERANILKRTVYPTTTPPQVEYAVTQRGRAFEPVFRAMEQASNELFGQPAGPTQSDGATAEKESGAAVPGRVD